MTVIILLVSETIWSGINTTGMIMTTTIHRGSDIVSSCTQLGKRYGYVEEKYIFLGSKGPIK